MVNLLKFILVAAVVAAGTSVAIALFAVVSIATIGGTTAHLLEADTVDLVGLIAGRIAPWVAAAKLANFVLWLRRSHQAANRLKSAIAMAYNSPGLYGVRDNVLDAMVEYQRVFNEQAGWLAINRKTALALIEAELADARRAIRHIDTRSM